MRVPAAGATVIASAALLAAAWQLGQPDHAPVAESSGLATQPSQSSSPQSRGSTPAPRSTHRSTHGPADGSSTSGSGGATQTPSASATTSAATAPKAPATRTVTGSTESTPYGDVQVAIVVSGGRITDVRALHLTDSSPHSVDISAQAAPVLRQEALAAQSAHIDAVSGATFTSDGYIGSLQAAIDAAHI